jgi:hypothetical protein
MMTSYERVLATVRHQPVDRAPCDFSAEPGTLTRLYDYFGIHSLPELLRILGIDRWTVRPRYVGPPLRRFPDGSYEAIVSGGPIMLDVPAPVGGVNPTTIRYPWADVRTTADLEGRYGWDGHIDWWDFSAISDQLDTATYTQPPKTNRPICQHALHVAGAEPLLQAPHTLWEINFVRREVDEYQKMARATQILAEPFVPRTYGVRVAVGQGEVVFWQVDHRLDSEKVRRGWARLLANGGAELATPPFTYR